jgi:hypothetical protein
VTIPTIVAVLVCRVGELPVVEAMTNDLSAMQALVGGYVETVALDDGVDVWCNDMAIGDGLPCNRWIPSQPPQEIYGDFFVCRSTDDGEVASLTAADIVKYTAILAIVPVS